MTIPASEAPVRIVEAASGRLLRRFIRFAWTVYRDDPYWVAPPIRSEKRMHDPRRNPFLQHSRIVPFLALRQDRVVGRIAAIINGNYNAFHHVNEGFWGFFECLEDEEAARALFDHVADWFRQRGIQQVWGPMNPSTNHECGLLVDGFDSSPMFMMTYNPRYYVRFVEGYGMEKARDLYAYRVGRPEALPEKVVRVAQRLQRQGGYVIRPVDVSRFDEEVAQLREIYNDAWSGNWGFVPFTDAEFRLLARELRRLAVPELCPVAEKDGRIVAFLIALPDANAAWKHTRGRLFPFGIFKYLWYKRKIDSLRVVVLGMRKGSWNTGATACLYHHLITTGIRLGYRWCEMSWILEENPVRRIIEMFGATVYKTYRIYRLPVEAVGPGRG